MAKKAQKKASSIDMTAMCDVAFLLLTFFILTATAKPEEVFPVDTPSSTVQTKVPDDDLGTITIGGGTESKVFYDLKDRNVRMEVLKKMGLKYGVEFSEQEAQKFGLMTEFGVPITRLKELISLSNSDRNKPGLQPGIPKDSLDNQLEDWIRFSSEANIELKDKRLKIAIRGDAKEDYQEIREIMDILQNQKINSFSLVTGLRAKTQ